MDEPRSVKDGAEDTNERVVTPHTEMCDDCRVCEKASPSLEHLWGVSRKDG